MQAPPQAPPGSFSTAPCRGRIEGGFRRSFSVNFCEVSPRLRAVAELKASVQARTEMGLEQVSPRLRAVAELKGLWPAPVRARRRRFSTAPCRGRIEGNARKSSPSFTLVSPRLRAVAELKAHPAHPCRQAIRVSPRLRAVAELKGPSRHVDDWRDCSFSTAPCRGRIEGRQSAAGVTMCATFLHGSVPWPN